MKGTVWLLPLVAIALYVGALLVRIVRQFSPRDPDRSRAIAVVGTAGIIGSLPWIVIALTTSAVRGETLRDLYVSNAMGWPVIGFHGLIVCTSLAIGLWIKCGAGSELLIRHGGVFMVPPISKESVDRIGTSLLAYPIAYVAVLFALNS